MKELWKNIIRDALAFDYQTFSFKTAIIQARIIDQSRDV